MSTPSRPRRGPWSPALLASLFAAFPVAGQVTIDTPTYYSANQIYTINEVIIGYQALDTSASLTVNGGASLNVHSMNVGWSSNGSLILDNLNPNAFDFVNLGLNAQSGFLDQKKGTTVMAGGLYIFRGFYNVYPTASVTMQGFDTPATGNTLRQFAIQGQATVALASNLPTGTITIYPGGRFTTGSLNCANTAPILELSDPSATESGATIGTDNSNCTFAGQVLNYNVNRGGLTKVGTGTLTLSNGTNNYSGPTRLQAGAITLGHALAMQNSTLEISAGATFNIGGFAAVSFGGLAGNGNLPLGSTNLTVGQNGDSTAFSGVLSGSAALTKVGAGTLTLGGANTYTNGTTISAGTLAFAPGGSVTGTINNGGTVALDATGGDVFLGANVSGPGTLRKRGPGTAVLSGSIAPGGGTIVEDGILTFGNGAVDGTFSGNIANSGQVRVNRASNLVYGGLISGSGGFTKTGPGNLTFSQAQTYTGPTLVGGGGTLTLANAVSAQRGLSPSSAVTVTNATLRLAGTEYNQLFRCPLYVDAGGTVDAANPSSNAHTLIHVNFTGGRLTNTAPADPNYGAFVFEPGNFLVTGFGDSTIDATAIQLQGPRAISIDANARLLISSVIQNHITSGTIGSIAKTGGGTLVLTGNNTFSGGLTVNAGLVQLGSLAALGAGTTNLVLDGGGVRWLSTAFDLSPRLAPLGSSGARFHTNGLNIAFGTGLSGANGFTKEGSGRLTLNAPNTYGGFTSIDAGTLALGAGSNLGNSTDLGIGPGATFDVTAFGAGGFLVPAGFTIGNAGTILGVLRVSGTLYGSGTYASLTVNAGGLFDQTSPFSTAVLTGAVVNNGTMRFRSGAVLNAGGATSFVNNGLLDLISAGPGTTLPANFVNGVGGLVLTASVVKVKSTVKTGADVTVKIDGYTGHNYQLQRSASLSGGTFTDLGASQAGATGSELTFTVTSEPGAEAFYRVAVD